jgi:hypothetical protein
MSSRAGRLFAAMTKRSAAACEAESVNVGIESPHLSDEAQPSGMRTIELFGQ